MTIRRISTDSADGLVRRLGARYLVVLALVALLMVIDQAVVQPLLVRLDAYAPAINLSGRQRMLSQKLTKAALALQASDDETARSARRAELRDTLDQWSRAHDALLHGDAAIGIRKIDSPEIAAQWKLLQPHFDAMCAAASRLIDPAELRTEIETPTAQAVGEIVAHEAAFLTAMDRIVKLMEERSGPRDHASAGVCPGDRRRGHAAAGGTGLVRRSTGDAHDSPPGRRLGIPRRTTYARTRRRARLAAA